MRIGRTAPAIAIVTALALLLAGRTGAAREGLAFHVLADESIRYRTQPADEHHTGYPHVPGSYLYGAALDTTPLFTIDDIERYEIRGPCHMITLRPAAALNLSTYESIVLDRKGLGVPFVVTVGDEHVYLGALWSMVSSFLPRVPRLLIPPAADRSFCLDWLATAPPDPRLDARIVAELRRAGVFVERPESAAEPSLGP